MGPIHLDDIEVKSFTLSYPTLPPGPEWGPSPEMIQAALANRCNEEN